MTRPCRIPCPPFSLRRVRNFLRFFPRFSIVSAGGYPDGARRIAGDNLPFRAIGEIFAEKQPDCAGVSINDRSRVAIGIAPCGDSDLHRLPSFAVIKTALQHNIDVARITAARASPFTKREQRSLSGHGKRGDAVGVIPFCPRCEEGVLLFEHFFSLD